MYPIELALPRSGREDPVNIEPLLNAPRDLVYELSRVYRQVGLSSGDALRAALADLDEYVQASNSN